MKHKIRMFGCLIAITLAGCTYKNIDLEKLERVTFTKDITPIFNNRCTICHREEGPAFSLKPSVAYQTLKDHGLVNGNNSILLTKLKKRHSTSLINENQLKKIELWIKEGALEN
ncbi:hypothetical protein OAT16_06515 [Prolixibacteraceae bacterium]|nr:hypothetical protein [Prolixibacteraceae bacterium]